MDAKSLDGDVFKYVIVLNGLSTIWRCAHTVPQDGDIFAKNRKVVVQTCLFLRVFFKKLRLYNNRNRFELTQNDEPKIKRSHKQ